MEFVEVMKHKGRLCNGIEQCGKCILSSDNNGKDVICSDFMVIYSEEAEKVIMKWAEEHPVKTNKDKFNEIFPDFPVDIVNPTKQCKYNCSNYPNCYGCNSKEALEFWDKEYQEVEKDAVSN